MSFKPPGSRASSKSKDDSDLVYDTVSGGDAPVDRHDILLPGQGGRASDESGVHQTASPNTNGSTSRPAQENEVAQGEQALSPESTSAPSDNSGGVASEQAGRSRHSSGQNDDTAGSAASFADEVDAPRDSLTTPPPSDIASVDGPQTADAPVQTGDSSPGGEVITDTGPVNSAPTGITASSLGVDENSSGGAVVATLSATDSDAGDTFTYSLVSDPSGYFQVSGDQIIVAPGAAIDYETVTSHDVSVQVTDSSGNTYTQSLTITVNDVDEFDVGAVTDTDAGANTIQEDASAGDLTGIVVNAQDADGTDTVSYSVDDARFTVDPDGTVRVATGASFDTETEPNVTITITATSSDGSTSQQNFNVGVSDVDEFDTGAVTDSDGSANNVNENSVVGTVVGVTAVATDADATDTVTYSLSDDAGGLFSIDANTGVVTVAGALDAEGAQSHNIEVMATSTDGSTSVQTFSIGVNDVDEFNISATTDNDGAADQVSESATVGTAVGVTALASDADVTDTVSYSLTSNPGGFFAIDANTGVVTVANALDYESATDHTIQVTATSSDGSTSVETFTIDVLDSDEFDVGAVSDVNGAGNAVDENSAVGTSVGITASATDADGSNSDVTYTLSDDASGLFQIDANTGVVTVAGALDAESAQSHSIEVTATSDDGSTSTQTYTVNVNDVDEFDATTPTDSDGAANIVAEDANVGDVVGVTALASDGDVTNNGITYSLSDDSGGLFQIDANTGVVTVAGALDYETATGHTIEVTATSADGSTSTENFSIGVSNVNESGVGAVSDSNATGNNVDENSSVGTVVGVTAIATDADVSDTVTYSLTDNAGGLFSIDANTGVVTVAGALNAEGAQSHNIEVTATSSDGSTSAQSFTIGVNDVDEFNISATTDSNGAADQVSESATVGTAVGVTALATDADVTDTVTYSLTSNPGGFFAIDANTGVVTVANALDYESATDHTIQVTATSADGSTSVETFTIDVLDADEFDVSAISDVNGAGNAVDENSVVGTTVGITASATDADGSNSDVTYTLSDDAGGLFAIDANTGVVTVAGAIDREAAASYDIEVTATSDDGSTSTQNYTVNVNDIDEFDVTTPVDANGGANTVAEDANVGTVVGVTASASDGDATNSGVTYSLSDDAGGLFTIDANTGVVTVAGALDYETATGHTIEVTATSADGSTSTENFSIGVTDTNEAGVGSVSDSNASANNVDENSSVGTVVGITGVATDPDGTDTVTYTLTDDAGGLFSIDANTGVVTVAGALDAEGAQSHNIEVTASSSDGSTSAQTFTIGVNDLDEFNISATTDSNGAADQVSESAIVGTAVGVTALATDADVTDTVTYSLTSNPGGFFAIDANTGVVTVANALDYESATDHTIQVTATSADGSTSVETFTIDVLDSDEFDVGAISDVNGAGNAVDENSVVGTSVGITASATDADGSNSDVTYSLSDDAGGLFAIDANTGVVTVAGAIDREAAASYDIEVTATSDDGSTSTQNYTVNVNDIDEFDTGAVTDTDGTANSIAENVSAGTTVGVQASASDADATNNTITYSVDDARFTVDPDGTVRVANGASFDTETEPSVDIVVTATSADGSSSNETFTINVSDVDEFDVGAVTDTDGTANAVNENVSVGTTVGIDVTASDADTSDSVTYSLSDDAGGLFTIDANTGVVTVAGAIDREAAASHDIEVTATSSDGSTSVQTFTINVNDIDEFDVGAVSDTDGGANTVAESATVGTSVGITALASDADATNSGVTYTLSDDAGGLFTIDANTGEVTVASGLDYETATSHTITVQATSADGSTSTENFTINVSDADEFDVGAISDVNGAGNAVDENSVVGTTVGITASATDADGSNSDVTYTLSDDAGGLFAIDANTGVVTVAGAIDREAAASYDIEVTATSDDGSTSTQTYTVNVNDIDEFDTGAVTDVNGAANTVSESAANGTAVGITASASDADATNSSITYTLVDGGGNPIVAGPFAVDGNSGVVTIADNTQLDYESATSQTVYVKATSADGSSTTETFTVNLTDADEFDVGAITDTDGSANTVAENASVGATVGIDVTASDGDATNSTVTYSLSDDAGGLFTIDGNTGEVTVAGALDYETDTSHTIEVTATSDDGSSSVQTFNIGVSDINEAPTDMTFTGNENLAAGGNNIVLNDGANNEYVSASSFNGFPDDEITFEIEFSSTTIPVNGAPLASYTTSTTGGTHNEFTILARADGSLDIYIEGVAQNTGALATNLFDGTSHTLSVSWDNSNGQLIVYVDGSSEFSTTGFQTGHDFESGGTLIFGQEQDSVGGSFNSDQTFVGEIGEVRLFNDVRTAQEIADNYNSEFSDPSSEQGLVSNWQMNAGGDGIVDEAGNNDFTLNNGVSIEGGDTILAGTVVADVSSVIDPDSGDTFTFALTDDASGMYEIDANTGEISLVADHDISAVDSDTVTVQVTDSGGLTYSETIGIHIGTDGGDTITGGSGTDIIYGMGAGSSSPTSNSLSITNSGFESASLGDGGWDSSAPSGWTGTGAYGTYNPNDGGIPGFPGGQNVAVVDDLSTLSQTLSDTFTASNTYDVSIDIGTISGFSSSPYEVRLFAGGQLVGTYSGTGPAGGTIETVNFTFDGSGFEAFDGQALTIEIAKTTDNGSYVVFDDVQLTENVIEIDVLSGGDGDDIIYGGDSNDVINGDAGNDSLYGGAGDDILDGGAGADAIDGGDGSDTVDFSSASAGVTMDLGAGTGSGGDAAGDTYTSIENITGSAFDDDITGDANANVINSGAGADTIDAGAGNDTVNAGAGDDVVNLGAGDDLFDTTVGDEDLGDGDDIVNGGDGNDTIWGGGGSDIISGDAGNDTLHGESGSDTFIFQMGGGTDTIDGGAGGGWTDTIQLQDASGGNALGTYGVDWTVSLSSGTIDGQDGNGLDLSDDADGIITLSDGSIVNFTDVERIDF